MGHDGERQDARGTGGHHREDLAGEHPWGDAGQIIALLVFLAVWILDSFVFRTSTVLTRWVPWTVRIPLAVGLFGWGLLMARAAHGQVFGPERGAAGVLRTGVFARLRHPLYLAVLLFYVALFVSTLSLVSLVFGLGIFWFYNVIAGFEERLLEEKFGDEYRAYKQKTPRWFPRWGS